MPVDTSTIIAAGIALRIAFQAATDPAPSGGGNLSVAIPAITAVIVLIGTLTGLVFNRQATSQRLAFERAQWEAAQAEQRRQADRDAERQREERERARAVEFQEAVRRECGECMENVRRLMADLDAATNRLLAAHELVGQKDRRIAELEAELAQGDAS